MTIYSPNDPDTVDIDTNDRKMKNKIIALLLVLPFFAFGQSYEKADSVKIAMYADDLNKIDSRDAIISIAAKSLCQVERMLDIATQQEKTLIAQGKTIEAKSATILLQNERLLIQEAEIASLKRTIKSLDIVVEKQVEEIRMLEDIIEKQARQIKLLKNRKE